MNNTMVTADAIAKYVMLQIRNISTTEKRNPHSDIGDIIVLALFQRDQVCSSTGAILMQFSIAV
jgi:hypothetical protein